MKKGRPYGARQLLLLNNTLYVGAVADPAQIWVVDATTLKLKTRIKNTGKWMTGLHYSAQTGRVYAANGSGEILVINPRNQRIEQRWKPLGDKPALLLNMAEDSDTGRLFVTDNSKAKTTLVLDIHSGKLLKQLDVGDSLAVQFNKKRHEIYISQRESGKVISLDASRYTLKKSWALPANPNSLLLSADGQTLFVTVKQPFNKDHSTKRPGQRRTYRPERAIKITGPATGPLIHLSSSMGQIMHTTHYSSFPLRKTLLALAIGAASQTAMAADAAAAKQPGEETLIVEANETSVF